MKKILKSLKQINYQISRTEEEIDTVENSTFYKVFASEGERQKDLKILRQSLKDFLSRKHGILDDLKRECGIEMIATSKYERTVTLLKEVA